MAKVVSTRVESGNIIVTLEADNREELVDPFTMRMALDAANKLGFHNCAIAMNTKGPYPVDAETGEPLSMPKPNVKVAFRRDINCVFNTMPF